MVAASITLFDAWQGADFWNDALVFLSLVLQGLGVALFLGIPAGIVLTRLPRIASAVIGVLGLLQTFPSLALLGLLIPWLGLDQPAYIFLAVVYSLFPVVMNTHVGITQVPAAVRDAARGMGMTGGQILWNVDLPLALPVILAGVRTGAVYAIGIITVCALAGAGSLGLYIVRGMARSDNGLIWTGAIPILVLTLLMFWGLGGIARLSRRNSRLGLVFGGGLIGVLSLYAAGTSLAPLFQTATERDTVRLGSKNFVEGEILTELLRQMLEAHTDLRVEVRPNLAPSLIYKAIRNREIDLYPEYTGNLLTNTEALDLPVPADKSTITGLVRRQMRRLYGLVLLETFGLNNTYAFCTPRAFARRHRLRTISDLKRLPKVRVVVDIDFLDRPDGWQGLVKTYDLHLPRPQQVDPDLRYRALPNQADVVCGFATDWQLADPKLDLVVLRDNRNYFPNYHAAPLVRAEVLEQHPEIATVLNRLQGQIDDPTMRRLNYEVARKGRSVEEVAREFLEQRRLLERAPRGAPVKGPD